MFSGLPPGFTLDLNKFRRSPVSSGAPLPSDVPSDYNLGFIFGAYLEGGVSHLSRNRNGVSVGSVRWYVHHENLEFSDKLISKIDEVFGLRSYRYYRPGKDGHTATVLCNNQPLSRMFRGFGKGSGKNLPPAYMVDNPEFLRGIYDGISGSSLNKTRVPHYINRNPASVYLLSEHIENYLNTVDGGDP